MYELPLNALRAFAAVYSNGGVRAAARELSIAHSSVSRHLSELSAWLGVALVRESAGRRELAFTPQGEALGRATVAGFQEVASAVSAIRESRSGRAVTVSVTPSFATRWLLPRLPAFESSHPRIELSVMVDQRLTDLEKGGADLAVRIGSGPWPQVYCEPLMDDILYPVMSESYWKSARCPGKLADLPRLRLIHDRDPQAAWQVWRQSVGPAKLDVRSGPRFASTDLVLQAAKQGQGVALARHQLAADDVASGALVRPFGDLAVALGTSYWLIAARSSQVHGAVATVAAWLKSQAAA